MSQPAGTQLQVNLLNGEVYASQYMTGIGGNGIANALASPDCANGCDVRWNIVMHRRESYSAPTMEQRRRARNACRGRRGVERASTTI